MSSNPYIEQLQRHYELYFGRPGKQLNLGNGPREKLHPDFFVLEIPPNKKHSMFVYCTVGMSVGRLDEPLTELFVYSPKADMALVELMTVCASYHRNKLPLGIHHTVNIGKSWLGESKCDHGFISLPYLDGEDLEVFNFEGNVISCYWFIPITEKERDYKIENGCEALEQLFEAQQFNYLDPLRRCLITGV